MCPTHCVACSFISKVPTRLGPLRWVSQRKPNMASTKSILHVKSYFLSICPKNGPLWSFSIKILYEFISPWNETCSIHPLYPDLTILKCMAKVYKWCSSLWHLPFPSIIVRTFVFRHPQPALPLGCGCLREQCVLHLFLCRWTQLCLWLIHTLR